VTKPNAIQDLAGNVSYRSVSQCALVLEDNPVGDDSRLDFESFPEDGIEEAYTVEGYREIAGSRMPQPLFAAYRGGNWNAMSLVLNFRAGDNLGREVAISELSRNDLDALLVAMERKARWCQALSFPLERNATTFTNRVKAKAIRGQLSRARSGGGISESALRSADLSQLTRNDPPILLLVFGSFLTVRCYTTGYSLKWTHPFHPLTAQPYGCEVTLSLQRLELEYPTWDSIRNAPGALPPSPLLPRLQGTSLVSASDERASSGQIQSDNAGTVAGAGSDPSAAFSVV
jgi:hypothetical protein